MKLLVTDLLTQLIGTLIILIALGDIYLTVLQSGNASLLSNRLNGLVWRIFRRVTCSLPRSKDRILSYAGPTLIPATIVMWVVLLSVGFALIFLPVMGSGVIAASGETPTGFWPALYFSMISLATLGAGDLIATTNFYRLLDTFGALAGFSVLTAALSYLMSVYSALTRHNSFALALQHATGDEDGSGRLLAKLGAGGEFTISQSTRGMMATELIALIESHQTYTVLRYFRPAGRDYALPRVAFLTLDTASLIRSAIDQEHYHALIHSTSVAQLWGGGMQMLTDLGHAFLPHGLVEQHASTDQDERQWKDHFDDTLALLRAEGIAVSSSPAEAAGHYVALRRQWQPHVSAFSDYLLYEWSEIHTDARG